MARIDKEDLERLKDLADGTKGVYRCVEQMKEQLQENEKSQRIREPQPRYTPDGDLFFEPIKKTNNLTSSELKDLNDATRDEYDKHIKDILREEWKEMEGYEQASKDIEKVDMAMLMEHDVEYTHQYMEDQEKVAGILLKDLEREIKLDGLTPDSLVANFVENEIDQFSVTQSIDVDAPEEIKEIKQDGIEAQFSENVSSVFDNLRQEDLEIETDAPEPDIEIEYDED